jgi:signal transduction histidine kinase
MLASAALVFAVVYIETGVRMQNEIDKDLRADVTQLTGSLQSVAHLPVEAIQAEAHRYITVQPYTATSTLLFVLIPGEPPISNHPEVFGSAPDEGETAAQQNEENLAGLKLRIPHAGYSTQHVADVGEVRLYERPVLLDARVVIVGAGEPLASVHAAQNSIARAFALAGALSLALALFASYVAGARVTLPLRRMAAVAARVDAGDLEPRIDQPTSSGEEVRVLTDAFNHMLDRLEIAFERQRGFIADASHELRTPLTVIRGQLEVLAAQDDPAVDEVRRVEHVVQAEVTRMTRLVEDLLLLTAADQANFLRPEPIQLVQFVSELWDGLELTADRRFEVGTVPPGVLTADPDRLAQALRNLARNAIEHTTEGTGLVRLEVRALPAGEVRFTVIDDGPGIPAEERERVFERLYRTDASRSRAAGGSGLGLSIVRAIAEAHGGEVHAGPAPGGAGESVELTLPDFRPGVTTGGRRVAGTLG